MPLRVFLVGAVLLAMPLPCRAAPHEWKLTLWPKLELKRSDGAYGVRIGGRALLDGARIHYDGGLQRSTTSGWDTDGIVRQGRVFLRGHAFEHLVFKGEVDFGPSSETILTDAFIGWEKLGPFGSLLFGHQKIPFSLEQAMSRLYMTFMERSLANALDPSVRDVGFTLTNRVLDDRLGWSFGGFRSTDFTGRRFSEPTSWTLAGRVTGLPFWQDGGRRLVHVGAAWSHTFGNSDSTRIRQRPESFVADFLVDTGTIPGSDRLTRMGIEAAWVHGPLSVQAEYIHAFVQRVDPRPGVNFPGFYFQASWFVTGEHRRYHHADGKFGPILPNRNFEPWKGGWGALQLAARVSYVDLNDADVRGGRQTDTTVGINWFLHPLLRLTFNWVHGWVASEGDVDVLQGRVQVHY